MRKLLLPFAIFLYPMLHAQWISVPPGSLTEFESVLVDDDQRFLVAGEDGVAFRTTDGGDTWAPVTGLGPESIRDFLRLDDQTILAASDGVVLRSADNGGTWSTIATPATDDLHALAQYGTTVLAVGRSGWIIRSNDEGLTWTALSSGTTERLFCVAAISATDHIAAGKNGTFLRSNDAGTTWTTGSLSGGDDWVGIHFFSSAPLTGLICGEGGTMARTTDGGISWDIIDTGIALEFGGMASENDSVVYVAASNGTVLRSTDMGLSWNAMSSPAFSDLFAIHVRNGMAVAAGANGTVIKLGTGMSGVGIAGHFKDGGMRLFPVPASDHLQLKMPEALTVADRVEVVTLDGRTVLQEAWRPRQVVDVSTLANGFYNLRLCNDRGMVACTLFAVTH